MDVVVIMDGPETVSAATDTSFGLMLAAQERDHRVWHCSPANVSLIDGLVWATASPVTLDDEAVPPLGLGEPVDLDLTAVDVVFVRIDPPVDVAYLHLTLVLDALDGSTLVVNAPRGLRDANEKLYAGRFPEITPPTIVTADADRLLAFAAEHGAAVVKPIDGHGGRRVFIVRPDDPNAPSIIDALSGRGRVPIVAQRFLAAVEHGDKRILLLEGQPLGAILRRPAAEDFRANVCVGGSVKAAELDEADHRIIEQLAPSLRADGLAFVGIDVIDDLLIEINVTSPTGLRQLCRLSGRRPDLDVVRWIERRTSSASGVG